MRTLNVGIMQYQINDDTAENLNRIRQNVEILMNGMNRPEIILGPELGLGPESYDTIPGGLTRELGELAKEYGIYLMPGSMMETVETLGQTLSYNTLVVFGPDGKIRGKYRKMCPYYPAEELTTAGDFYFVLDIPEKDTKLGFMICHDWCFPEIARNLTLMGAEILVRPAIDPEGLYESFKTVPGVRALENQAYFISINAVGYGALLEAYGHSMIADPEGRIIYEAGDRPLNHCITLDLDLVERTRQYGTFFTEQLLRQIPLFKIPMPFAGHEEDAPIFHDLPPADRVMEERDKALSKIGMNRVLGDIKRIPPK